MKKGFTLIELLAVIVILAIIALIATPIVLSIIEETKESATLRSAEYYLDAVEQSIMKKSLTAGGSFSPNKCIVQDNGNLLCDEKDTLEVELSGEVPSSGTIIFEKGKISNVDLTLSNKRIVKNDKGEMIYFPCTLLNGDKETPGSKYECEVKPGSKHNFYVLSKEDDGTTNLIMDRNINSDGTPATKKILESNKASNGGIYNMVAWLNQVSYEGAGGQNWSDDYAFTNTFGPITAMSFLDSATSTWSNIPNLSLTYDDEGGNFTNFEVTGKARLPYHSEVYDVGCLEDEMLSCPVWMVDYLDDAGPDYETTYQENPINGIAGYWTFFSGNYEPVDACSLYYDGCFSCGEDADITSSHGVRPVINIKL